jgi:hypothetical protein
MNGGEAEGAAPMNLRHIIILKRKYTHHAHLATPAIPSARLARSAMARSCSACPLAAVIAIHGVLEVRSYKD